MLAPFLSVSFSRAQGRVTFRVCNFLHTPEPLAHDTTRTTHTTHTHTMLCQQVDTMTLTQPPDTYSKRTHRPPRLLQSNGLRPKSSSWPPAQPSATLFVERQTKPIVTSRPIRKLSPFQPSQNAHTHTRRLLFISGRSQHAPAASSKQLKFIPVHQSNHSTEYILLWYAVEPTQTKSNLPIPTAGKGRSASPSPLRHSPRNRVSGVGEGCAEAGWRWARRADAGAERGVGGVVVNQFIFFVDARVEDMAGNTP